VGKVVDYADYAFNGSAPGAQYDLELEIPNEYELVEINQLVAIDENSAPGFVKLGLKIGDTYHWYKSSASPTAGTTVSVQGKIYARGGQKVVARFANATAGDDVRLFVNGKARLKE